MYLENDTQITLYEITHQAENKRDVDMVFFLFVNSFKQLKFLFHITKVDAVLT